MDDATYMALLVEVSANQKRIISCDHPDAGKLIQHALKELSVADRQIRALSRKAAKIVTKPSK